MVQPEVLGPGWVVGMLVELGDLVSPWIRRREMMLGLINV